ncbi:hypothetical protein DFJ43DRAFT_1067547 [Lentinula guzmanii]|uniref:Uncharacterized protein n=1 Tax=Lentinula guzmanii TaxID=2804957 RepID=A0AA38JEN5_9AGAR|nr:hypothetical protein DFJ43DRAFT_1067547 [Lentinula guzmanii]
MLYQLFPSGRSSSLSLILIIALFSISAVVATPIAPYDHHWLQPRVYRRTTVTDIAYAAVKDLKVQLGVYNIQENKWEPKEVKYQPFGIQTLSICFEFVPCFAVTPTGKNAVRFFKVRVLDPASQKQNAHLWDLGGTASFHDKRRNLDPKNRGKPSKELVYEVLKDVSKLQASLGELGVDITIIDDTTYVTGVLEYVQKKGAIDRSLDMEMFNQIVDNSQKARKEEMERVKKAMSLSNII